MNASACTNRARRVPSFVCSRCRNRVDVSHTLVPGYSGGTGYARPNAKSRRKICYTCCASIDAKRMDRTGRIVLYLCEGAGGYEVTNWPGTLRYKVSRSRRSVNKFGSPRVDFWFTRLNETTGATELWYGAQIGEHSQIAGCRRLKS